MSKLDKILILIFTFLMGIVFGYTWAWKALEGAFERILK